MWIQLALFITLVKLSDQTCQMFKNTVTYFMTERTLYKYIVCTEITPDNDLRSEILTVMNSTAPQYIEVSNSNLPEIRQDLFLNINISEVRVQQSNVQIIQEKAFENSNISMLILEDNQIKILKDRCFNSSLIYKISLKNNSLNNILATNLVGLVNLNKLNLQNNRIVDIQPESFNDLTNLEELNLSFNKLNNVPTGLFQPLKSLLTIYLNNNFFKIFSADMISQCVVLQYLYVQNNHLTDIDARLYSPSILSINASGNHLTSFNFSNLLFLDTIDLNYNKLTKAKDCLNNLPSLKFLNLNYNYIGYSIVNETFQHLKNLTVIEIDKNNLKQFDFKVFDNLEKLRGVSLAENELTSLDFSDFSTSPIKALNLSSNSLNEVKNLSKLKDLITLELSMNNFEEINYNMFENMHNLKNLRLPHNSIRNIELGCFRDLNSLTKLDLSYNKITKVLPGVFTGLKVIIQLDISHNNLSNFDEDIFHNTNHLTFVNIAYNHINDINVKQILSHMPWLREINLNGNNWSCLSLINVIRDNKYITLTHGTSFNVSNVYGVACNNTEDVYFDKNQYLVDLTNLMNFTMSYTKDISYKMSVNNIILIVPLVLFSVRLIYVKYSSHIAASRQFIYKPTGEQEMQLV